MTSVESGEGAGQAGRRCSRCGAELGERGELDLCPACGLPVSVSLHGREAVGLIDGEGNVTRDAACLKCGYNLRGLPRDGRCPECAAAVSLSVGQDLLCYAEPRYVDGLSRGNTLVAWGLLLLAVALSCVCLSDLAFSVRIDLWLPEIVVYIFGGVMLLGTVGGVAGGGILLLLGAWIVTLPQPGVFVAQGRDRDRRFVRAALLALLGGTVVGMVVWCCVQALAAAVVVQLALIGMGAVTTLALRAFYRYARGIAKRVPRASIAECAKFLSYGMPIAVGVLTVLSAADACVYWASVFFSGPAVQTPATGYGTGSGSYAELEVVWSGFISCGRSLAGLVGLILLFLAASMHHYLAKPLRQQAGCAKAYWQRGGDEAARNRGAQAVQTEDGPHGAGYGR